MNTNHFNDAQVSISTDSRNKNVFDYRQQTAFANQQSSNFDFKKPRFGERNSCPRIPLSVNRSKLAIPYKSELCMLFQRGKCYYGENCHFAHKMSEIRKLGLKTAGMEGSFNDDSSKRNANWRGRECHFFSSGVVCPYGDRCHFLHRCDRNVGGYANSVVNGWGYRNGRDNLNAGGDYDNLGIRKRKNCIYGHGHQGVGSFAEVENGLDPQCNDAASCEARIKIAKKLQMKGKRCFMKWDAEKIGQIYADCLDS